jgi:hypothetical protein
VNNALELDPSDWHPPRSNTQAVFVDQDDPSRNFVIEILIDVPSFSTGAHGIRVGEFPPVISVLSNSWPSREEMFFQGAWKTENWAQLWTWQRPFILGLSNVHKVELPYWSFPSGPGIPGRVVSLIGDAARGVGANKSGELVQVAVRIISQARGLPEPAISDIGDGGLVIDYVFDNESRITCVLRSNYAHVMTYIGSKFYDETLVGPTFSEAAISEMLRLSGGKAGHF